MNDAAPPRRIWLCADDYGISPGVNRAIRDLIERGRLNATSVMVVGALDRPRRSPRARSRRRRQSALRHRPARHADGAVQSADDALPAARRRHVPALPETAARRPAAAARSRDGPCRIDGATRGLRRTVRPRAGLRRRPSACAVVSRGARRLSGRGEASRTRRLGSPGRTQPAFGAAARRPQGAGSRHPERAVSPPRRARRYRLQPRIRRRL